MYLKNKGGNQYSVNGDADSNKNTIGITLVLNNQDKVGVIPNVNVDGATPLILVGDLLAKPTHQSHNYIHQNYPLWV